MTINITYTKNGEEVTKSLFNYSCDNPNQVYEEIGKILPECDIPSIVVTDITDVYSYYEIIYDLKKRGSYIKNGIEMPSMFVTVKKDTFKHFYKIDYTSLKETYLTCVNPESNNYKFYHMTPTANGIEVEYGRIGANAGEMFGVRQVQEPYDLSLYWVRYYEKLSKGYIDNSKAYLKTSKKKAKKTKTAKVEEIDQNGVSEVERELYNLLFNYSKHYVREHLKSDKVTEGQVSEANKIFKQLCERKTVKGFNSQLLKLIQISPRRVFDVSQLLATKTSDFSSIIDREETLINAMKAVLSGDDFANIKVQGMFKNGVQVFEATEKQKEEVMAHLSDNLKSKVDTIYRVIPTAQKAKFDKYLVDNNITKVKQLWHGSRNENWLSIIENGLSLSVNRANGRMFGNGIYFAPSSEKSWNYTSYYNTYWARGSSDTAFMGLYATAYGKPLDCYTSHHYTEYEIHRNGCNCVHAHAGSALRNDEIVFYNESATLLNYIVKFK